MPHGRVGLIVADVSGKGVPAALLMSSFRASLLAQDLNDEPAEILARLNGFLHKSVEPGRFVTAFFGVLDPANGRFVYSNAGHNPPYWIHASGKTSTLREGGLVLGLFGESRYEQAEVRLQAGDTLALFTDGVTEAQNPDEELWGDDRFLQVVIRHVHSPCRRIVSEVLRELRRFAGDEVQSDDITLLLARWNGAPVEPEHGNEPTIEALRVGDAG
jgi:sigma-B regulation protein RsbU (phosphoserine phosphatase)